MTTAMYQAALKASLKGEKMSSEFKVRKAPRPEWRASQIATEAYKMAISRIVRQAAKTDDVDDDSFERIVAWFCQEFPDKL